MPDNFGYDEELSRQFAPVWYQRAVRRPAHVDAARVAAARARLRFAAVDYLADVWLNGEHLGHHEGYFAPFGFDVTDRLAKDNELVVRGAGPARAARPRRVVLRSTASASSRAR